MQRIFIILGALAGFGSVLLGAFGAHMLRDRLSADNLQIFEVGVRYQMYHAFALFVVAWLVTALPSTKIAGWLFTAGIVIFSGSLYALALSGIREWGAVTPIGGLALLGGWANIAYHAWKRS